MHVYIYTHTHTHTHTHTIQTHTHTPYKHTHTHTNLPGRANISFRSPLVSRVANVVGRLRKGWRHRKSVKGDIQSELIMCERGNTVLSWGTLSSPREHCPLLGNPVLSWGTLSSPGEPCPLLGNTVLSWGNPV